MEKVERTFREESVRIHLKLSEDGYHAQVRSEKLEARRVNRTCCGYASMSKVGAREALI